jgi:hypothetical protein
MNQRQPVHDAVGNCRHLRPVETQLSITFRQITLLLLLLASAAATARLQLYMLRVLCQHAASPFNSSSGHET